MQLENYDEVMLEFEEALTKKIDRQKNEYFMIRAGRANPRMLDKITADYSGGDWGHCRNSNVFCLVLQPCDCRLQYLLS